MSEDFRTGLPGPVELRSGEDVATLVRPAGAPVCGVVIAHGGSDDGRRFFLDEAASFAARGAAPCSRWPTTAWRRWCWPVSGRAP